MARALDAAHRRRRGPRQASKPQGPCILLEVWAACCESTSRTRGVKPMLKNEPSKSRNPFCRARIMRDPRATAYLKTKMP
eukprot:3803250-Rhodomonas_salina.1